MAAAPSSIQQTIPPWIMLDGIQFRVRAEH